MAGARTGNMLELKEATNGVQRPNHTPVRNRLSIR